MRGEDDAARCLRLLHERRAQYVDSLAAGAVSAANVIGGYINTAGVIRGFDEAIETVTKVFDLAPMPDPPPPRKITDY